MADSPDLCAMIVFGKTTEIVKRNTPSKTDTMCYASCRTLGGGAWHKNSLWWSLYHFVMLHPLGTDTMCQFCLACVYPETFLRFDTKSSGFHRSHPSSSTGQWIHEHHIKQGRKVSQSLCVLLIRGVLPQGAHATQCYIGQPYTVTWKWGWCLLYRTAPC